MSWYQCVWLQLAFIMISSTVIREAVHPDLALTHSHLALGPRLRQYLLYLYRPIWITGLPYLDVVNIGSEI